MHHAKPKYKKTRQIYYDIVMTTKALFMQWRISYTLHDAIFGSIHLATSPYMDMTRHISIGFKMPR